MFLTTDFSLKLLPSPKYLMLVDQYTNTRERYQEHDPNELNGVDRHFRAALKKEWQAMQGVKHGRRYPSVEVLHGKTGDTLLFNQDHADVWNFLGIPVMVTSMPYVTREGSTTPISLRAFEAKHGLICQRMSYPGWHFPPATALDVWMLA